MALHHMRAVRLALTVLSLGVAVLEAQTPSSKGTATSPFGPATCGTPQGLGRDKKPRAECLAPSPGELSALVTKAKLNALERFAAEAGEAGQANFDRVRDTVAAHLDDFVLGSLELVRVVDTPARQASITVRVDINAARLANLIQGSSAVGRSGRDERSLIGVFVMAREQASVERFDGEVRQGQRTQTATTRTLAADSSATNRETQKVTDTEVLLRDSVSRRSRSADSTSVSTSSVRSASTVQRADRVLYSVSPAEDLNAMLTGQFAKSGFETVESVFLDDGGVPPLIEAIKDDFGAGNDLATPTLLRLVRAAQAVQVPFVLVGTLDVGMQAVDPVTGGIRVYAKVTGKVLDLRGRLPRTVASVEPVQHAGVGPTLEVARSNALRAAADAVGREAVARLNVRDIK